MNRTINVSVRLEALRELLGRLQRLQTAWKPCRVFTTVLVVYMHASVMFAPCMFAAMHIRNGAARKKRVRRRP